MSKVLPVATFATCLLGALLSACSYAEPGSHEFVLTERRPAKAVEEGNTLAAATTACKLETQQKGIKSILSIVSRFRPGDADKDYIACMKKRGYDVVP